MVKKEDFSWATKSKTFETIRKKEDVAFVHVGVDICTECGRPHDFYKTCSYKRRSKPRYRVHAEMRDKEEVEILEELAKINGYGNFTELCRDIADTIKHEPTERFFILSLKDID